MPGSQYFTNPAPAAPAQSGAGTSNAFLCASQADMLASYSSDNDICIRTDLANQCFVLVDAPSNILANWVAIKDPQAAASASIAAAAQTTAAAANNEAVNNAYKTLNGKAIPLTAAEGNNLQAWASAATAKSGLYDAVVPAQNGLPLGWYWFDYKRYSAGTATNQWNHLEARSFGSGNTASEIYQNTQVNGVWTGWIKTFPLTAGNTTRITHAKRSLGTPQVFSNGVEADVQMAAVTTVGAAFGTWSAAGVFTFSEAGTYQVKWHHSLLVSNSNNSGFSLNIESTLNSSTVGGQIDGEGKTFNVTGTSITVKEKFTGQTIKTFAVGETLTLKSKTTASASLPGSFQARNDGYGIPKNQAEMMIHKIA